MAPRSRYVPVHEFRQFHCVSGSLDGLFTGDRLLYRGSFALQDLPSPPDVALAVPLEFLSRYVIIAEFRKLLAHHRIKLRRGLLNPDDYRDQLQNHVCSSQCKRKVAVFQRPAFSAVNPFGRPNFVPLPSELPAEYREFVYPSSSTFPPPPMTLEARAQMLRDFTAQLSEASLAEVPCAVCAELVKRSDTSALNVCDDIFKPLARLDASVAVLPRTSQNTTAQSLHSPILEHAGLRIEQDLRVADVCSSCLSELKKDKLPSRSLANGLWVGEIPPELLALNYCEKLMVARFRHNTFVVSVLMGQRRMSANAVTFAQPVAKFHAILPPPPSDLESCLVVLFTGSSAPTADDMRRTPLIIRKQVV
ncbi:hypothetical protein QCA50_019369 [Cerrena zonata]|uniref:DUF6570 domain-containing protein n=1 Tax=Cerrena zonata TaxID=2478898 RepID=A0AAW0F9L0_9APHY